jgi:hypothetical protein
VAKRLAIYHVHKMVYRYIITRFDDAKAVMKAASQRARRRSSSTHVARSRDYALSLLARSRD